MFVSRETKTNPKLGALAMSTRWLMLTRSTFSVTIAVLIIIVAASSLQIAHSNECNGIWQEDSDPYSQMECANNSCSGDCCLGFEELSPDTTVYWCQCGCGGGEPNCCHTIQKIINGEWQQPTGSGTCAGSCGPGSCREGNSTGFACG